MNSRLIKDTSDQIEHLIGNWLTETLPYPGRYSCKDVTRKQKYISKEDMKMFKI